MGFYIMDSPYNSFPRNNDSKQYKKTVNKRRKIFTLIEPVKMENIAAIWGQPLSHKIIKSAAFIISRLFKQSDKIG